MINYKWTVNPLDFMKSVDIGVVQKTLEVGEAVFDGVVERSPVDTGSFRSSWTASVNEADTNTVTGGSSDNPLLPPKFPKLNLKPGDKLIVSNNKPYGPPLEDGHSQQAPNGMVALTIASLK